MLNMRTNCLDGFRNLRIVEFQDYLLLGVFRTKDPPKNQYVIRSTFLKGSLVLNLNFSIKDHPKKAIHELEMRVLSC